MNFDDSSIDDDTDWNADNDRGGMVIPKQNCEHVRNVHLIENFEQITWKNQCVDCENTKENWLCVSCGEIHCGRYQNNHGEEHWLFTLLTDEEDNLGHCLTVSLEDLSIWCYSCKSYILNARLNPLIKHLESLKFPPSSSPSAVAIPESIAERKIAPAEDPSKLSTIIAIQDPSLLEELKTSNLLSLCSSIALRSASIDELASLHSSDYVNRLVGAEKNPLKLADPRYELHYDEKSLVQARISAGTTIDAIEAVLKSHINGFVMVTSPGHRALTDHGNGKSLYNNIALAVDNILHVKDVSTARKSSLALFNSNNHLHLEGATPIEDAICHMIHVLTPSTQFNARRRSSSVSIKDPKDSPHLERVLIVDLTTEHGCGLQSIFYESKQVFYISVHNETHQHRSSYHECGKNEGLGYNMNIPLASFDQLTDTDYVAVINELVLPICREYRPELIVIAVDFHIPQLTTECYGWIVEQLSHVIPTKLVVVCDGDLDSIQTKTGHAQIVLGVLLGQISFKDSDRWKWMLQGDIQNEVQHKIQLLKDEHSKYWTCFQ